MPQCEDSGASQGEITVPNVQWRNSYISQLYFKTLMEDSLQLVCTCFIPPKVQRMSG